MKSNLNQSQLAVVNFVQAQLGADMRCTTNLDLSLCAKWCPSISTSSRETRRVAHILAKAMGVTPAKYRKTLSALRTRLNVLEKTMSAGEWESIDFEAVPSKAGLLYKKAFSVHQAERYVAYLAAVKKGDAKINSGTLFPYEIIRDIAHGGGNSDTVDALWNNLPDYLKDNPRNVLVLPDVSGSMMSAHGTTVSPIWVSISLAIYCAQRNTGLFKDHFLEFSATAKLRRVTSKSITAAWNEVRTSTTWCGSTNLQSAFDAILSTAVSARIPASEMPASLVIISDMEFDSACNSNSSTNFEVAKQKYRNAGYELPNIVFWNVAAHNDQSPVKMDERGVALVSGCSPSTFKEVMSESWSNPYELMLETINADRYASVVV